ncbi:MAG: alpha/beta hydrolase, partial [Algoriella sp.]
MNIISLFHSYKFTHFQKEESSNKTQSPSKLNTLEKINTLIFGVNNPKPKYIGEIPTNTVSKKLQSNVEIEIWENIIPNSKGIVLLFHGYSSEKSS